MEKSRQCLISGGLLFVFSCRARRVVVKENKRVSMLNHVSFWARGSLINSIHNQPTPYSFTFKFEIPRKLFFFVRQIKKTFFVSLSERQFVVCRMKRAVNDTVFVDGLWKKTDEIIGFWVMVRTVGKFSYRWFRRENCESNTKKKWKIANKKKELENFARENKKKTDEKQPV